MAQERCRRCGAARIEGDRFCAECGETFDVAAVLPAPQPPASPVLPAPPRAGKTAIIATVAAVVIGGIGAGAGVLLTRDEGPGPATNRPVRPAAADEEVPPVEEPPEDLPLRQARVEGDFTWELPTPYHGNFTFEPNCASGACDVVGRSPKGDVRFGRHGNGYRGRYRTTFECDPMNHLEAPVTLRYSFRVTAADTIEGEWRAVELSVKAVESWPRVTRTEGLSSFTCEPAHFEYEGSGSLISDL